MGLPVSLLSPRVLLASLSLPSLVSLPEGMPGLDCYFPLSGTTLPTPCRAYRKLRPREGRVQLASPASFRGPLLPPGPPRRLSLKSWDLRPQPWEELGKAQGTEKLTPDRECRLGAFFTL